MRRDSFCLFSLLPLFKAVPNEFFFSILLRVPLLGITENQPTLSPRNKTNIMSRAFVSSLYFMWKLLLIFMELVPNELGAAPCTGKLQGMEVNSTN